MGRLDIVALLDVGEQPSTSGWAVAAQVEATLPSTFVHVGQLEQARSAAAVHPPPPALLDRALDTVLELSPAVLAIGCNVWNMTTVLELCDRVHRLAPGVSVVLGGLEAEAREAELLARGSVQKVIRGAPAPGLVVALQEGAGGGRCRAAAPGGRRRGAATRRRRRASAAAREAPSPRLVTPIELYGRRVGDLARSGRASGRRLIVEEDWGHRLPLCLAAHVGMPSRGLTVEGALRRLRPLLRAGVPVRLADPALCLDRDRLIGLLRQLEGGSLAQLDLELPVEALLDRELLCRLRPAGVCRLELDLHGLACGRADPGPLRAALVELGEQQIGCSGALACGLPWLDSSSIRRTLDAAVQCGLDDLRLERLLVPPGSRLALQAGRLGLVHAIRPPYEVLAHPLAPHAQIVRSLRLAAVLDLLRDTLPGTGLLRVLGAELGSATEILEGFAESLFVDGQDPLRGEPAESAERALLEHLRRAHGLDLSLASNRLRLVRAPLLAVRWTGDGRRLITDDSTGRVAQVGRHALNLLDRFDRPQSAHQVCEQVVAEVPASRRGRLRREVQQALDKLVSMSFLVPDQQSADSGEDDEFPFTCLEEFDYHYRMLSDSVRVAAYRRAIEQAVRPGQHVVEIGTGTGILAVLAAKAGGRVTAIERFSVLGMARSVARKSGVEGDIQFIRGRSDLVRLEEPGDLLISEIVGNRILNEGLLEVTLDARRRLLRPEALLIPEKIEIFAEVGRTDRFDHLQREFQRVGSEVGVNLEPLANWFQQRVAAGQVVWELDTEGDDFLPLAAEVSLLEIDLRRMETADFAVSQTVVPAGGGLANAIALAFRLELQPGIELSTRGRRHGLHWSKPVFMLRSPLVLRRGQPVVVKASYEAHGDLQISLEPG